MGFLKEFRDFALKGNVLDMAVGVIIGAEFGKIVNSMINDLLMPIVGSVMPSGINFQDSFIPLADKAKKALEADPHTSLETAKKAGAVLAYGNFITVVINFVILAFCIFIVVKAFNMAKKRFETEKPAGPPPPPPEDVILLREIRDALKAR